MRLFATSRVKLRPLSQPEHEQHGLVAHFAKFRRIYERALGNPAKPGQNCDILLAANLKGHGRSVEADTHIDLPKLLKAEIVIGSERSIDEPGEEEPAGRCEGRAVIGILFVDLLLDLAGDRIDDDDVGFVALRELVHAAQYYTVSVPTSIGIER